MSFYEVGVRQSIARIQLNMAAVPINLEQILSQAGFARVSLALAPKL